MTTKLVVLTGFLFAAACASSGDTNGVDAALAAGADIAGTDASGPPTAVVVSTADIHSRAYWERKWVGSAAGVTVQFEVTSFDFDERLNFALMSGYASSVPCLERIGLSGTVNFGNETNPQKYPVVTFDSDSRLDGPQASSVFFEGPLYPTGRVDGILSFGGFGGAPLEDCVKQKLLFVLSPVD